MKAEFSNTENLSNWLSDVVSAEKYDLYYVTLTRRLIAVKNVSTEPRLHGFVNDVDIDDASDLADSNDRKLITVKSWEWEHDTTEPT